MVPAPRGARSRPELEFRMPPLVSPSDAVYRDLYHKANRLHWVPADVDLSRDRADWDLLRRDYAAEEYAEQIYRLCALFYQGEASVTRTLAPYLVAVSRLELGIAQEMVLASQLYEEAKHFDFFSRYFREVLDEDGTATARHLTAAPQALLIDGLDAFAKRLTEDTDPTTLRATFVEAVTYYMGVVEAMVARTGYQGVTDALVSRGWMPGLCEGFRLIRRDEGRHVAYGIHCTQDLVAQYPEYRALVERTFETNLSNVVAIVQSFAYPHPIVDVGKLTQFALSASVRFLRTGPDLIHELDEA